MRVLGMLKGERASLRVWIARSAKVHVMNGHSLPRKVGTTLKGAEMAG
jgi:hypothetical protein